MGIPTLATATLLIGIVLAPPVASQSRPTSKPQKPDFQERLRRAEAHKQARRWVTFLELDDRRAEATDALLRLGQDAAPALVLALNNPRPVVVQRVCHILRFGSLAATAKEELIALSNSEDPKLAWAARYALADIQPAGITLIADYGSKVFELDKNGKVVRTLANGNLVVVRRHGLLGVERLPNGNYLICDSQAHKVVEMTAKGKVVWSPVNLMSPISAQRLPNGNTLITHYGGHVFEVNRAGRTVWKYVKRGQYTDGVRLVTGNTLIADDEAGNRRVIEVTPKGAIVWEHKLDIGKGRVWDADRLENGNTLIALSDPGKVIEVTPKGKVVWELKGLKTTFDADRLPNGHTLVAQKGEVAEYDAEGKKVWSANVGEARAVNRY